MFKLNSKQLRDLTDTTLNKKVHHYPMYFILDNIYDTYNIGGLFRLADALAIEKIFICGESEIPPNHKIVKASIGTYKIVPWEYKNSALEAINEVRNSNSKVISQKSKVQVPTSLKLRGASKSQKFSPDIKIISIEQTPKSVNYINYDYQFPLALVVGNESFGVSKEALEASDAIVDIPMYGINQSLNVIIATSIVSYHIYQQLNINPFL